MDCGTPEKVAVDRSPALDFLCVRDGNLERGSRFVKDGGITVWTGRWIEVLAEDAHGADEGAKATPVCGPSDSRAALIPRGRL